jgi:ketosteroid isomerase-like protein
MRTTATLLVLPLLLAGACSAPRSAPGDPGGAAQLAAWNAIEAMLDDWHRAAAAADGERYFGHMTADSVFLGTDATERWTLPAFREFCAPYFARGQGWTYVRRERHVEVEGDLAWFDERLWYVKYGEVRGTGVVRREDGRWRIAHYSMSFPVPNELAPAVVEMIRGAAERDG